MAHNKNKRCYKPKIDKYSNYNKKSMKNYDYYDEEDTIWQKERKSKNKKLKWND